MSSGREIEDMYENSLQKASTQLIEADFTREQLVDAASFILTTILERREPQTNSSQPNTIFQTKKIPKISLHSYLQRIANFAKCSENCFVLALIYLDRITEKTPLVLNPYNIHRLMLISISTAAKFADEQFYTNKWYSEVGGVGIEEFNALETEFLVNLIQFELFVCEDEYKKYHQMVQRYYLQNLKISEKAEKMSL